MEFRTFVHALSSTSPARSSAPADRSAGASSPGTPGWRLVPTRRQPLMRTFHRGPPLHGQRQRSHTGGRPLRRPQTIQHPRTPRSQPPDQRPHVTANPATISPTQPRTLVLGYALGPWAGLIADRSKKRRLLLAPTWMDAVVPGAARRLHPPAGRCACARRGRRDYTVRQSCPSLVNEPRGRRRAERGVANTAMMTGTGSSVPPSPDC